MPVKCEIVRSNRSADRDFAALRDLLRHESEPADVQIAVLLGETRLRRQAFPDGIAVEQGDVPSPFDQPLRQALRQRRRACTESPVKSTVNPAAGVPPDRPAVEPPIPVTAAAPAFRPCSCWRSERSR